MHIYIETEVDEDGYPPYEAEEIDAVELGPGRARIAGIPVFVYGIARGDIVQFEVRRDGLPWAVAILENSDHWTCRALPLVGQTTESVAREFAALGCEALATSFEVVAVDVPPEVPYQAVIDFLERGHVQKRWDYDLGVDPRLT